MESKQRWCIVMEQSAAVNLQSFDQPESLMFSVMSANVTPHSQISPSLWVQVNTKLKPMCRFKGRFEEEEGILFTDSGTNEKFTLGLEDEEVGKKVMWSKQGNNRGSREVGRRENDCDGREEQKISSKM